MAIRSSAARPSWLLAALVLAAAPAVRADWLPVGQDILNRSTEPWVVNLHEGPSPKVGYSIKPSGTVIEGSPEVLLPPGAALTLFVDSAALSQRDISQPIRLHDRAGLQGEFICHLQVTRPAGQARFSRGTRVYGTRQSQFVMVAPHVLAIVAPAAGAELKAEVKAEPGPAASAGLAPLREVDVQAGVHNPFLYYTTSQIRVDPVWNPAIPDLPFAFLHAGGHQMPTELLADYFFNTIFQYYVRQFMGYDPNLNYDQYPTLAWPHFDQLYTSWLDRFCAPRGQRILPTPAPGGDFREFINYKTAFENALAAWKRNPGLLVLGAAYMRQKIVTEKLQAALLLPDGEPDKARVQKVLLERDRLTGEYQTMIFHWMEQGFTEFLARYKAAAPGRQAEAGDFLERFQPRFLADPQYAKTLAGAMDAAQPADSVEGIALPASGGVRSLE